MIAKSTKSQITMLMIVGLALFIIVSLVLYLSKSAIKKQSQQSIKKTQETAIEIQPVKEFVTKCLDKLGKDAIVLLGKQGGYIYISQGGTLIDYSETDEGLFFVKHNGLNIAYNILPPRFEAPPYSSDVPDYPWQTFPYKTETSNAEIFEGYFGISTLPPLNSSEGPNSIQVQIESFIDKNMASCTDFSIFQKQGFDVTMEQTKTSVIIGNSDISIKSNIPITITNPATNDVAEFKDFSANLNIRLGELYFFTRDLIDNDIKNIKFDIGDINNSKDSISVKLTKDIFSNDDLIIITDDKLLVYGRAYEYIFARRNRAPALHYTRKIVLEFPTDYVITETDLLQNSTLKAYDPDEDNYTFKITPALPKVLIVPQIKFKVEVSDDKFSDYQTITVNRA